MNEVNERGENLDFLQSFLDASPNGVMIFEPVHDRQGKTIDFEWRLANVKAVQILALSENNIYGKHFLEEIQGHASRKLFELGLLVMETGESLETETSFDTESWFLVSLSRLQSSLVMTMKDVSQKQRVQQELESKHEELDRFFNLALDLLTIANSEGILLKVNKAWEYCLGYTVEELEGKAFLDFVHPDDVEETVRQVNKLIGQEPVLNFVNRYRTIDGTYRYIQWRSQPFGKLNYAAGRDITESRLSEEALRESEEQFRALFEQSSDAVFIFDLNGRHININHKASEMLGYSFEELIAMEPNMISAEPDASKQVFERLLSGEKIPPYERLYRHKNGRVFPVDINVELIRDAAGNPIHCQAIVRDISERKSSELAIRESEQQFRALFEQSNDAVFIFDLDGKNKIVNQKAADLLGYSLEEIYQLGTLDISAEVEATFNVLNRLKQGEHVAPYERLFRHKDGRLIPVEINITLVHDEYGRPVHFQSIVRDIRERKKAEQSLREREQQFRALFEQSNDAVFLLDFEANHKLANRKASELLGYSIEELVQMGASDISADIASSTNILQRLLEGAIIAPYERIFRHKDGSLIPVEINVELVYDDMGRAIHIQSVVRDIRERKKAEQSLRERERQFRALFEQSNDAVFLTDLDGRIELANQRAAEIFGYSQEEMKGMPSVALSAEEVSSRNVFEEIIAGKKIAPFERLFRHKDGSVIPTEINLELVRDAENKPLHVQSVVRDIRERKKAEAALEAKIAEELIFQDYLKRLQDNVIELTAIKKMDDFYRRAVELGIERFGFERLGLLLYDFPDAVGTYGTDGSGRLVSEADMRFDPKSMTGILWRAMQREEHFVFDEDADLYSRYEIIGRGQNAVAVLWNGEDKLGWLAIDNAVEYGEISKAQLEILALYALSLGSLLAQKRIQENLRESETLYRSIVTMMAEGLVLQDSSGKIITANAAAERILEVARQTMIGSTAFDPRWSPIHEDGSLFEKESYPSVITLRTGKPVSDVIMGMPKPDGEVVWVAVNTQPLFHPNETKPYAVVVTFADISKRIKSQQQALELQIEKERINVISSFIQGSSHEFRTPLAIIKSNVYLMKRLDDPEKRIEKANAIELQIDRILSLLTMLNKMSQLDSNITMKWKLCHILSILEHIRQKFQSMLDAKDLSLKIEGTNGIVRGGEEFLIDAFGQLILNAIQFSKPAGEIRVNCWKKADSLFVTIEDDGEGMDANVLPHIFERFYRMDTAHSTAGFGLGLPLAQSIIEKHDGEILVESEVGKGSRFIVRLPIIEN